VGFGYGDAIRFRIDAVAGREVEEPGGDVKELNTRSL